MAIQNRRGAYENFNPDKLKSGEWATVLSGDPNAADGRATYLCYEPGIVKRMATFEDMEENVELSLDHIFDRFTADMQTAFTNANAALATMQTATTEANSATKAANDIAVLVQQKLNAGDFVGPQGQAATVSVGNVSTGAAGSQVQVTARGTSSAVILDFVIPQGAKGDPGTITNLSSQTVAFSVAGSDVNIETGETLAVIFGKLSKSVQTLRTELSGKAASGHKHSTSDITSGTLPLARGGTGQTTLTNVKKNFGITALEDNFANLVDDETIALATSLGIDLSGVGGGVALLNRLAQLWLTNPVVSEYDSGAWHVKEYANGWVEQEGVIDVNLSAASFSSSTGFYCRNATVSCPVAVDITRPCSVLGLDASGGASGIRVAIEAGGSLGLLTFTAATVGAAVMAISLKVSGYKQT